MLKYWNSINLVSIMLWPLSLFFCGLVALRRSLYKHRLIKSWRAPVPVIVVGNISVGGTGKTPVVVALIELLRKAGFKPGVVSRGYRGTTDSEPVLLDNKTAVAIAGDEAVLIQQRTTGPVCVFSKRIEAIKLLLQKKNCDIIIADDGLQHYAMQRDLRFQWLMQPSCMVTDFVYLPGLCENRYLV